MEEVSKVDELELSKDGKRGLGREVGSRFVGGRDVSESISS